MLEFIEGLAAMAVLDQDGVYTYVSPGWERYTGHTAQEAIGRKVWEMVPDTHATEVFHTGKPVFAKAVNANGPAFTSYFPRFDRDGKLCGLFLYVIVQGMEDAQNLTRRIGELSSKVEFYQQELSRERGARYGLDNIIGESASVLRLKEQIVQAARSTSTVLIEGETGSGKELIAHSIHAMSARKAANFVRVNCSAIPAELMESEFFGYAAGAFTGAARKGRIGRFQQADGGTIFLDEIGEIDAGTQVRLLRVLSERTIERVGSNATIPVNVRVIAATNKSLKKLVQEGKFREDLYFRLNVVHIQMPPLRDRREDIPLLATAFLKEFARENNKEFKPLSRDALEAVRNYQWPGNVRELRTAMEHGVVMSNSASIDLHHLPPQLQDTSPEAAPQERPEDNAPNTQNGLVPAGVLNLSLLERNAIQQALAQSNGNKTAAAHLLGISRRTLQRKLQDILHS